MSRHIQDLQSRIKPRLREISQPSGTRQKHEKELPGFKDLLRQWKTIYQDVSLTILSLSRRIETTSPDPFPSPRSPTSRTSIPRTPTPPRRAEEVTTISFTELDRLLEHMRNSWEEIIEGDRLVYVNAFDRNIKESDVPANAYIRSHLIAPSRPQRTRSYERRPPR